MTHAVAQPEFLDALRALQPDLCVTAAYGNILPQAFLDIPRRGTLNIHPSLLPQYRGAAPVQRALQVLLARMSALQTAAYLRNGHVCICIAPAWLACIAVPWGACMHPWHSHCSRNTA